MLGDSSEDNKDIPDLLMEHFEQQNAKEGVASEAAPKDNFTYSETSGITLEEEKELLEEQKRLEKLEKLKITPPPSDITPRDIIEASQQEVAPAPGEPQPTYKQEGSNEHQEILGHKAPEIAGNTAMEAKLDISYVSSEQMKEAWNEEVNALGGLVEETPVLEADNIEEAQARLAEKKREVPDDYMPELSEDSVLYKICQSKREHIVRRKNALPEHVMMEEIARLPQPRDFFEAIKKRVSMSQVALIAEIKKASPSRGVIRENFKPEELAVAYTKGGATCISVLTDEEFFQGKDEYVKLVKTTSALPVLRKDFMLDPYQVTEARYIGADCILLIMAAISDHQALELEAQARKLGLSVLVEVHNEEELTRALKLQTKLIGINNRDLKTLAVDLVTTERLAEMIPPGYTIVCESGISTYKDILRMQEVDAHTFLVGESLMSQEDVIGATRALLNIY